MLRFKQFINEMAQPTKELTKKYYYHGTTSGAASDIAKNGIQPPDLTNTKENFLTPVSGKVYVTPHIHYAQIYSIGGDVAGSSSWKPKDEYGHLFSFSGKKLKDVQPDEDNVGEIYTRNTSPDWLTKLVNKHTTSYSRKKAKEGEYHHYANIGKRVLPHMSDEQKLELIQHHNAHVAHTGTIIPDRAYRIHRDKIPLLNRDGSNFFDHAEELDMEELAKGNSVVRRKRKPLVNS